MSAVPRIRESSTDGNTTTFVIENVELEYINAVRRIVQSEIPIVYIHEIMDKQDSTFTYNTSSYDNELLEERLRNIPIKLHGLPFDSAEFDDMVLEINVSNTTNVCMVVSTDHFKLFNPKRNQYVDADIVRSLFMPFVVNDTAYPIELATLRPQLTADLPGGELRCKCKLHWGTHRQNSSLNVVSTIACSRVVDDIAMEDALRGVRDQWEKDGADAEEIARMEHNWRLLDGRRYTLPNTFQFVIETIGIFPNKDILTMSADILLRKLTAFTDYIHTSSSIQPVLNMSKNWYDVVFPDEWFELGNIFRIEFYNAYYVKTETMSFVSFKKMHPADNTSILRIAYTDDTAVPVLQTQLLETSSVLLQRLEQLKQAFGSL